MAGPWEQYGSEDGPWKQFDKRKPAVDREAIEADMRRMADPTSGMGFTDKFNAGMGKAFTDLARGAGQLVGMGPNAEEVRETRRLDAPLMNTGAGMAGNVAGNIAAIAPLAVIPGGATIGGAGALGMVAASMQPTESVTEKLTNQGVGLALGSGTQFAGTNGARMLGERAVNKQAEVAAQQSRNQVRDQTLKAGHEAGYVVPPSAVNAPTFIGGRLESLGGKAALGQESAIRNQGITDALSRRASGLGPDEAISTGSLKTARQRMSAPYREISSISPQAATDLEIVRQAKAESKLQWNEFNRQGTVNAYKAAQAADQQAEAALSRIEASAQATGRSGLVEALRKARVDIARNHEVRNALNSGTGSVDASVIGRAFDRSPDRFSGDLRTIGAFQQHFPHFMREGSKVQAPGVGKTELLAAALLAGGGGATAGPVGMLAGLAPFASGPTRSALLSKTVQDAIANPSYQTGAMTNAAATLTDPATREQVAMLLRALALPSIPQAVQP